jgi:hypothetical protein
VVEDTAEQMAEEIIGHENQHDDHQPQPGGAPGGLERQQEQGVAEGNIPHGERVELGDPLDNRCRVEREIDPGRNAGNRTDPVEHRWPVRVRAGRRADQQEQQAHHRAQKHRRKQPRMDHGPGRAIDHPGPDRGGIGGDQIGQPAARPPPRANGE